VNEDVEQLVREGLDRLAMDAEVPAGLVGRARQRCRRRRLAAGSAIASGIAAVTAVAVIAATGAALGSGGPTATHGVTRAQMRPLSVAQRRPTLSGWLAISPARAESNEAMTMRASRCWPSPSGI
jgi:hypothetical protein